MKVEELARALHLAGLNAFTHPQSFSADEWREFRCSLAENLLKEYSFEKVKEGK
jgi:hypothetical protein